MAKKTHAELIRIEEEKIEKAKQKIQELKVAEEKYKVSLLLRELKKQNMTPEQVMEIITMPTLQNGEIKDWESTQKEDSLMLNENRAQHKQEGKHEAE